MKDLIVKSNQVIRASYRISPNEQAIILNALTYIEPNEEVSDQVMYELRIEEIAELTGTRLDNAYRDFKEACFTLYRRELMISNGSKIFTRWVQSINYVDGQGIIRIQFSNQILPYLSNLKENFTTYRLRNIAKFKSTYGVRFYELCMQWDNSKKQLDIGLDELRDMFQLSKSYSDLSNIKSKVVEPALRDINKHSDINFSYENIKTGRKVTGFKFKWRKKRTTPLNPNKDIEEIELNTKIINHNEQAKSYKLQEEKKKTVKRTKQASEILKSLK